MRAGTDLGSCLHVWGGEASLGSARRNGLLLPLLQLSRLSLGPRLVGVGGDRRGLARGRHGWVGLVEI